MQKKGDVDVTELPWSNIQTGEIGNGHVYLVSQNYTSEILERIIQWLEGVGRKVPATWDKIVRMHKALLYCGETTHTDNKRFTQHCTGNSGAPLLNLVTNALKSYFPNEELPLKNNIVFTTDEDNDRMQGEAIIALLFNTLGGGMNLVSCGIRGSPCKELGQSLKKHSDKTVDELFEVDPVIGAFALSMANGVKP